MADQRVCAFVLLCINKIHIFLKDEHVTLQDGDQEFLNRYSLRFYEDYQLLVCTVCSASLGKTFWHHIYTEHEQSVDAAARRRIQRYIRDSVYLQPQQEFLQPVSFRPVQQGYKCGSCEYYSNGKEIAVRHSKTHDPVADYVECSVQRMNNSKHTPYVGVFPRERVEEPNPNLNRNPRGNRLGDAVRMLRVLTDPTRLGIEEGRRQGLFYLISGFLLPEQLEQFADIDRKSYVMFPELEEEGGEEDEEVQFYEYYRTLIIEAITNVNSQDVQLRFGVSPTGRPFNRLETVPSLQEYSLVTIRFIRFLILLVEMPIPGVTIPEAVREAILSFLDDGEINSMWKILVKLLIADPRGSEPSDLFTLFVRFCCTADEADLMKAQHVERLMAKVLGEYFLLL